MQDLDELEFEARGLQHAAARGRKGRDHRATRTAQGPDQGRQSDTPCFRPRSRKERRAMRMKRTP